MSDDINLPQKRPLILVVDDDTVVLENIKEYLTSVCNYDAEAASDGKEALEKIGYLHPSAIILDLDMPVLNGVELLKKIKEIDSSIPILIITAYPSFSGVEDILKNGACDFLIKPIDPQRIKFILDTVTSAT